MKQMNRINRFKFLIKKCYASTPYHPYGVPPYLVFLRETQSPEKNPGNQLYSTNQLFLQCVRILPGVCLTVKRNKSLWKLCLQKVFGTELLLGGFAFTTRSLSNTSHPKTTNNRIEGIDGKKDESLWALN